MFSSLSICLYVSRIALITRGLSGAFYAFVYAVIANIIGRIKTLPEVTLYASIKPLHIRKEKIVVSITNVTVIHT